MSSAEEQSVSNVRGIRAMALEDTFRTKFEQHAGKAKKTGNLAAWYVAIGMGASAALPLFAQGESRRSVTLTVLNLHAQRCSIGSEPSS